MRSVCLVSLNTRIFDFIFEDCILFRLLLIIFVLPSITTGFFLNVFITISYPLHISTPIGHLQLEYIYLSILRSYLCYNGSVAPSKSSIVYIYIYIYIYKYIYIIYIYILVFRRCLYICGGYDSLLFCYIFSTLSY
jgi:hypothetical protein